MGKKISFFRILFYSFFIERKKRAKKKGKTDNDFKKKLMTFIGQLERNT